jgi:hypothetical protein
MVRWTIGLVLALAVLVGGMAPATADGPQGRGKAGSGHVQGGKKSHKRSGKRGGHHRSGKKKNGHRRVTGPSRSQLAGE